MAAPRPKPVPHTVPGTGSKLVIWGDHAKVLQFFPGLAADTQSDVTTGTATVAQHTVSRYPGDPAPYTRRGHTRTTINPAGRFGNATPGRRFTMEVTTGTGIDKETDVTVFTYVGALHRLLAYAETTVTAPVVLRSPGGKPYKLAPGTP